MRTITVTQPALTRSSLVLTETGDPVGSFKFNGMLQRSAEVELSGHRVTFASVGLLGRTDKVYDAEGGALGEFRQAALTAKGEATINGRPYRLRSKGAMSPRFFWIDSEDTEVVRLKIGGILRWSGTVEVADDVAPSDAAALVGLG